MGRKTVIKLDRTRRKRHWSLGDPPRRRARRRLSDPRTYLKIVMAAAALGLLALPYGADAVGLATNAPSSEGCRVARVVDGDTVTLWCPDTGFERARLLGFDTPEKFSPECASEFAAALQSEWALRRVLFEGEALTVDRRGLDRYDRRLTTLVIDGNDVADLMIANGHARAYRGGQRGGWCE